LVRDDFGKPMLLLKIDERPVLHTSRQRITDDDKFRKNASAGSLRRRTKQTGSAAEEYECHHAQNHSLTH
jgi:hypothetical protein